MGEARCRRRRPRAPHVPTNRPGAGEEKAHEKRHPRSRADDDHPSGAPPRVSSREVVAACSCPILTRRRRRAKTIAWTQLPRPPVRQLKVVPAPTRDFEPLYLISRIKRTMFGEGGIHGGFAHAAGTRPNRVRKKMNPSGRPDRGDLQPAPESSSSALSPRGVEEVPAVVLEVARMGAKRARALRGSSGVWGRGRVQQKCGLPRV